MDEGPWFRTIIRVRYDHRIHLKDCGTKQRRKSKREARLRNFSEKKQRICNYGKDSESDQHLSAVEPVGCNSDRDLTGRARENWDACEKRDFAKRRTAHLWLTLLRDTGTSWIRYEIMFVGPASSRKVAKLMRSFVSRHLKIATASMASGNMYGSFPISDREVHPRLRI